jgi:phosphohistidine swiveling domain-containing protein
MKDLFKTSSEGSFTIETNKQEYHLSDNKKKQIDDIFIAHGFKEIDHKLFFEYLSKSIAGREYGKFIFTKSVSLILEIIASFGAKINLDRDTLSHIPIERLLTIFENASKENFRDIIKNESLLNEETHKVSSAIRLPQILSDFEGIHVIPFQSIQPNFITSLKVIGDCLIIDKNSASDLNGKIILIEGADPGYDWIFNFNISGLVTMYGGANSHMAIRCAEFSIPAAIGCGEEKFNKLKLSSKILLDCSASLIDSIN